MISKNTDLGLLLVRISAGGLMLFHGVSKLIHGISFLVDNMGAFGYAVYIGEVLAPIAILIGFRTRIAAILLAVTCVVAVATAHAQDIFSISEHGGYALELLMLYLFGALALFFTGAGKYAVSKNNKWD
ncbi:putative oxidoreductase [Flavobacterium nitrogenifigens]|uniref:Oxidoreductase n=2 Tax=Flavobacterium TaxID=237 RepID=A0ABR6QER7_9FLAO|nr:MULTISPECIES: DoxX family protein [Flavobacterium]MBB4802772.1 putative oxidoreductase [Flavobacterium nitrogenifigens]MBB6387730.1 putative oxidoreductase [Flavobacterium notoginsengisoli]